MIRFLLGFFIWGLFFYALWYFFPDAFAKLVGWAQGVFDYLHALFTSYGPHPATPPPPPHS